jgi:DNA-binding MarR family transcriptional regulator
MGLARRGRAPNDRRRYALHITDKGRQTLDDMFSDLTIVERDVLDTLNADELAVLSTLLDRLYEATFHNG